MPNQFTFFGFAHTLCASARGVTAALSLGFLASAAAAEKAPDEVISKLGQVEPLGQVTYRWLGIPLYEATLFLKGRDSFDWQAPIALQLVYSRGFAGTSLVDATVKELQRIEGGRGDHAEIGEKLSACFLDVAEGDRYVAVSAAADEVSFLLNGEETCRLRHLDAKQRILGIWLSDQSRSVSLARKLRGL